MGSGVLRVLWPPDRIGTPGRAGAGAAGGRPVLPGRGGQHRARPRGSRRRSFGVGLSTGPGRGHARPEGGGGLAVTGSDQACRAISTGQLNALLRLHLRPIDVVVFHGPRGDLVSKGASRLDAFSGYPVRS